MVCFSPEKRIKLEQACNKKSPIKINSAKKSLSKFKDFQDEIAINENTTICDDEVDYPFAPVVLLKADAPFTNVGLLESLTDREIVSLHLFLKVSGFPKISVVLPYLASPIDKLEVCANDATGSIPLALWGNKILDAPIDGSYSVKNVVLRRYKNNSIQLTSNSSTLISVSDVVIEPSKVTPHQLIFNYIQLPAENVNVLPIKLFCNHCKKYCVNDCSNPILFSCVDCKNTAMSCRLQKRVDVKVDVIYNGNPQTVFIPSPQVNEYFARHKKQLPVEPDDIAVELLQDCKTKLVVDRRFTCVGFQ